jgi:hypothetical protein
MTPGRPASCSPWSTCSRTQHSRAGAPRRHQSGPARDGGHNRFPNRPWHRSPIGRTVIDHGAAPAGANGAWRCSGATGRNYSMYDRQGATASARNAHHSAILPNRRDKTRFGPQKRPGKAKNVSKVSGLYVVLACRPAAEFNGVGSGMAEEFGGMISHRFFSIVNQLIIDIIAIMSIMTRSSRWRVDFVGASAARRAASRRARWCPRCSSIAGAGR